MTELRFEWDPKKAAENKRKHGVSFQEAETVFADEFAIFLDDPDHSSEEARFLLLGLSARLRTLVVSHCYRKADDVVRLISARKATRPERDVYNQRWRT
ncbi:MAG: BrnT family toxin [Terriglobia bacterium]